MPGDFLTDDLTGILRTTEFAETVLVASGDFAGEYVTGIFDVPFADSLGVGGSTPVFVAASVPALCQGDVIEVGDKIFRLKVPEPDMTGITRYPLTEG